MRKPLIGITAYEFIRPEGWLYDVCYRANSKAIEHAGGLPVLIPASMSSETLRGIYERVDAVLLPGGGDVDPARYTSETQHSTVGGIDAKRDNAELLMTQWAVEEDRPVFGICRGIQVMNVALGGTLIQDIPSATHTQLTHDTPHTEPRSTLLHEVEIESNSKLASILGTTHIPVNSLHHQAIATPSPAIRITAHAPDGIPEAMELPGKTFAMAVQWHPEDLVNNDERMQKLFDAFVAAARDRMRG
jgi:putative glutamine amidotransferase